MDIAIEVVQTGFLRNGKRLGTWRMAWGHREWRGTWSTDDESPPRIWGDPVRETPVGEEALAELIYCTQDD
jgi:hypothetical protein